MRLSLFALLALLGGQAHAAQNAQLRVDLDGDGREDLVSIRPLGDSYQLEIFYTSGKPADTFRDLVPQESPDFGRGSSDDHELSLEKAGTNGFRIVNRFGGDDHMFGEDDIVVRAVAGKLLVQNDSYMKGHSGGDQRDMVREEYDFVNRTAFISAHDAHLDDNGNEDEPYHEKRRKLSAGCRPELREWKPHNVPACAQIKL